MVCVFFWMLGWDLSIGESIAIVIVIGFSVDYTVHFAHAYLEAKGPVLRRNVRTSYSFTIMGISVLFGALTTFGAALPLLLTNYILYKKMGEIIVMTIFSALLWATVAFPAFLLLLGPENKAGQLFSIHSLCAKKKEDSTDADSKPPATEMATTDAAGTAGAS